MVDYGRLRESLTEKYDWWGSEILDEDVMDWPVNDLRMAIDNNEEFKLYRYMPVNYYNIRNIETQKIHLSTNGVMNDIYDGLPILDQKLSAYEKQKLSDIARMTCFSETNKNPLMWAHYAAGHTGFCVEYDIKKIKKDPYGLLEHLFPVIYNDKRFIGKNYNSLGESLDELRFAIKDNVCYDGIEELDDILPFVLLKGSIWSYEQEWRIVYTLKQSYDINEKTLYGGNIEFPCISAVYLGYQIDAEVKENIVEICKRISTSEKEVKVYIAKLSYDAYDIEFEELKI